MVGTASVAVEYGSPIKLRQFLTLFPGESQFRRSAEALDEMASDFRDERIGIVRILQLPDQCDGSLGRKGMRQKSFRITGMTDIQPITAKPALRRMHLLVAGDCFGVAAFGVRGSYVDDFARIVPEFVEHVQHTMQFALGPENLLPVQSTARNRYAQPAPNPAHNTAVEVEADKSNVEKIVQQDGRINVPVYDGRLPAFPGREVDFNGRVCCRHADNYIPS
jgi:hypothetical protein